MKEADQREAQNDHGKHPSTKPAPKARQIFRLELEAPLPHASRLSGQNGAQHAHLSCFGMAVS
jgi:hypothetical protein